MEEQLKLFKQMAEVHHKQYQRMFRDDMTEITAQDLEIIKKL